MSGPPVPLGDGGDGDATTRQPLQPRLRQPLWHLESTIPRCLFPIWHSVPPEPHPTLIAESYRLEQCRRHAVVIERQSFNRSDILWEHGEVPWVRRCTRLKNAPLVFKAFRRRLLKQLERRRWSAALTDFTMLEFFCSQPPAVFVTAMGRLMDDLDGALSSESVDLAHPGAPPGVASLYRGGGIKAIFKGGNPQALMKIRCLELLPPPAREMLELIRPPRLSDIDMMLALNLEQHGIQDRAHFDRIHAACTAAVERVLHNLVHDVQACLRRGCRPLPWQQHPARRTQATGAGGGADIFARFLRRLSGNSTLAAARATSQLSKAVTGIRDGLRQALERYGVCPQDALAQLRSQGEVRARPYRRRSRTIVPHPSGRGIELSCYGKPSRLYVSSSSHVEFRDVRCIEANDLCRFGLVRLFLGFRLDFYAENGSQPSRARYSRGEMFDVSIPKRDDISLKIMCDHENSEPGSTITHALLMSPGQSVPLYVQTINAMIDENYDLTFGRNPVMDDPCIWRLPKVQKRLVRLMELLGIRVLALPGHSWRAKAEACAALARTLEEFYTHRVISADLGDLGGVCADSRIDVLLRGLRILALALQREEASLPADAWSRVAEIVVPVALLAKQFAAACEALHSAPGPGTASHLDERELYNWRLGDTWGFAGAATAEERRDRAEGRPPPPRRAASGGHPRRDAPPSCPRRRRRPATRADGAARRKRARRSAEDYSGLEWGDPGSSTRELSPNS